MSRYGVHALLWIRDEKTEEVSIEADDLDAALDRIRQLVEKVPDFRAVTLVHVEDLPVLLEASDELPAAETEPPP